MEKSAEKTRNFAGYDPQGCVAFLLQRYPTKTGASVAADTGDSPRAVENWLAFKSTPTLPAFGRLVRAYGPAFAAAAFPGLAWVERAAALASYDGLAQEIAARQARQAELAARLLGGSGRR